MLRRPPGDGGPGAHQRKYLLAFAVLLLSCISLVDAQHHQQDRPVVHVQRQPDDSLRNLGNDDRDQIRPAAALGEDLVEISDDKAERASRHRQSSVSSPAPEDIKVGRNAGQPSKYTHNIETNKNRPSKKQQDILKHNDARAVATLAPAQSVRAPPSTHRAVSPQSGGSGISSPPRARSLEEWEVEDFILLATVDGDLYASDRKTGAQLWHLEVDQPMVQTEHLRLNTSDVDEDFNPVDHYIWAVEPSRHGSLYIWMPGAADPALVPTGLTMKKLVEELSPLANANPPVIYTGTKKTTMITLDAATGRVLKWFGAGGSHVNEDESCLRPNALYDLDSEECSSTGTITLGRTEYEVAITRKDGRDIAKLRYSEWAPNNFDRDLFSVYHETLDNHYHSSLHDGRIYAFDDDDIAMFSHKFAAPVARVFDVCRPWGVTRDQNPDLVILPQPVKPAKDEDAARARDNQVFLNQTDGGSWYALSGLAYPLIVDAPPALASLPEWWDFGSPWHLLSASQKVAAMVGRHNFEVLRDKGQYHPPSLPSGSVSESPAEGDNEAIQPTYLPGESMIPIDQAIVNKVMSVPQSFLHNTVALLSNPVLILAAMGFLVFYRKDLIRWCRAKSHMLAKRFQLTAEDQRSEAGDPPEQTPEPSIHDSIVNGVPGDMAREAKRLDTIEASHDVPEFGETADPVVAAAPDADTIPDPEAKEQTDDKKDSSASVSDHFANPAEHDSGAMPEKKKAKSHRGRRGGVKHKKGGKKRETSVSRDDDPPTTTVDDAVKNAQKLGNSPKLEPDVVTMTNDMQSVTGPVIKLGNIEVDTEDQLGTGSNGTLVFAGKFDGREVAVKRMLIQFYDIASQETRLLRESDDHPNGMYQRRTRMPGVVTDIPQSFGTMRKNSGMVSCTSLLSGVLPHWPTSWRNLTGSQNSHRQARPICQGYCIRSPTASTICTSSASFTAT